MGLTKPAIYRHFPSKDALTKAMESRFLGDYTEMHRLYLERAQGLAVEDAVRLFVNHQFRFFYEHRYYYIFFLMRMLRTPLGDRPEIQKVMADQMLFFRNLFGARERRIPSEELVVRLHYLYVASIYWFSRNFIDCATGYAVVPELSPREIDREIDRTSAFCLRGMMKDDRRFPMDYDAVAKHAAVGPEEMLPMDRIFTAIEEAVAEAGLRAASVDRIAAKIGLSKSSLYFYFKNRDDMLGKMIEREQTHVAKLLKDRIRDLSSFPEKSFCYMILTASYTLNNPALLTVFNWLRFQNIDVAVIPPDISFMLDFFSFIAEAYEQGLLLGSQADIFQAASFLHILSFRIVMDFRSRGLGYDAIVERLRAFHLLYLYGFLTDTDFSKKECV